MERDNRINEPVRSRSLKASVKRRVGRFSLRKLSAPESPCPTGREKKFEFDLPAHKEPVAKTRSLGPSW